MEMKYTPKELQTTADELLAEAGFRWDGKPIDSEASTREGFLQRRFEYRMQTGAYSRSGESRRKA